MLIEVKSGKTLDEIEQALRDSAAENKFGVIAVHDLEQTLANKGVDLEIDCRVFEVCNPHQAKKVLDANGAISTALPCRISVYGQPGNYTLATMKPTEMMKGFDVAGIEPVAREVEEVITRMMNAAAR